MPVVGPVNGNLSLFRFFRTCRRNDLVDGSEHDGAWRFWIPRGVQIQRRYSCGSGHARLYHFFPDARVCCVLGRFLSFLMWHRLMMASTRMPRSSIMRSCEIESDSCDAAAFPPSLFFTVRSRPEHVLANRSMHLNQFLADMLLSLGPVLVVNSLCPEREERTIRKNACYFQEERRTLNARRIRLRQGPRKL